jgi:hypothetical protein
MKMVMACTILLHQSIWFSKQALKEASDLFQRCHPPGLTCTQVVAGILQHQFPNATVEVDQLATPSFRLKDHLAQAVTNGTDESKAFGPNSTQLWDYIVFQEDSQQVALGGQPGIDSLAALEQLAELAAARGAQPGIILNWAWLDNMNSHFPSFADMQASMLSNTLFLLIMFLVAYRRAISVSASPSSLLHAYILLPIFCVEYLCT